MPSLLKIHIEKKEFNHAYLLCGDVEQAREQAFEAAKTILLEPMSRPDLDIGAHPDFWHQKFELFGIDDSRELKNWAANKSFYGNGKVFVMEIFAFNNESANALLKLLEEPNEGAHFFIIAPSAEVVLPTLRSRMTVIALGSSTSKSDLEVELPSENAGADFVLAGKFLKDLPNKRMEIAKKLSDEKKEKKADKTKIVSFLNDLEVLIEGKIKSAEKKKASLALEELQKAREFVFDRGSSPKMILEHLALALPKF